jgi:hypothetical protein
MSLVGYDPEDDQPEMEFPTEDWESLADMFGKLCLNMISEGYERVDVVQALSWTLTDQTGDLRAQIELDGETGESA